MLLLNFCRQYVLLVPSVLQGGSLGKACAQLSNLPEHVFLNVSLNYAEVQTKIFEENVAGENFFKCVSFKVKYFILLYTPKNVAGTEKPLTSLIL